MGEQVQQELGLASGRVLDQLDQVGDLLGIQRQRRDAEGGAFGGMGSVGLQHDFFLRNGQGFQSGGDHQSATGMPTAKVVSASGPPTGAGFSYLVAGLSSRLGGGFFLKPSATVNCCGLMHSSAIRWPSFWFMSMDLLAIWIHTAPAC